MTAKVYVYSDSVLCLGKIHTSGEAIEPWKGQVATFRVENNSFNELLRLDGEPIEFEWKNFTGFTALEILHRIQCDMQGAHIEPEEFSNNKGNEASCTLTSTKIREYALRFLKGHCAFPGTWRRKLMVSWV